MAKKQNTPKDSLHKGHGKDSELISKVIVNEVEKGTGLSYDQLKASYSETQLFYTVLQYVTTTKRAVCEAFDMTIANNCWNKKKFQEEGILVQSKDKYRCPSSKRWANVLSTNKSEFERLTQSSSNQIEIPFE